MIREHEKEPNIEIIWKKFKYKENKQSQQKCLFESYFEDNPNDVGQAAMLSCNCPKCSPHC